MCDGDCLAFDSALCSDYLEISSPALLGLTVLLVLERLKRHPRFGGSEDIRTNPNTSFRLTGGLIFDELKICFRWHWFNRSPVG